jgi:hypothetical protein
MAYCSLTCGWMEIRFNIPLQRHTTLLLISMYMLHTILVGGISSERELALHSTACLLTSTSTDVNTTVMWWWILPNKTNILAGLGEKDGLLSVIMPKRFLKIRLSFLTHNCPNIWQKILTILSVSNFFSLYTAFSYQEIFLIQTIRREIAQLFMSQSTLVTLQHTLQPSLHMSQKDKCKERQKQNKNINFNDNFHFTSHS